MTARSVAANHNVKDLNGSFGPSMMSFDDVPSPMCSSSGGSTLVTSSFCGTGGSTATVGTTPMSTTTTATSTITMASSGGNGSAGHSNSGGGGGSAPLHYDVPMMGVPTKGVIPKLQLSNIRSMSSASLQAMSSKLNTPVQKPPRLPGAGPLQTGGGSG
eukprot:CAMPEP_0175073304 /NCGR_PEP_ID=MMETSP0052_2-20121109/20460_1 /TAXON_ID=51329 ORGANISM="Polytomella parva, Strain SAG 63-3" /NCGR_SAMPLE_ID=MMETSP0052_2 /ASSEMBLY_ACC=CAM_ASM_000194 /LENGTH=158 /DNA_ID=CAMNT_0016341043 /DNA_START=24 /DNA_END=496 /DNA_ORIENTATION=+